MAEYIEKCAVWLEDQNKEKYLVEAEKCYLYEGHFICNTYALTHIMFTKLILNLKKMNRKKKQFILKFG